MAIRSPKHGLTRSGRGWYRRVGKRPRWIVSAKQCPTGEEADAFFEANFAEIAKGPVERNTVTVFQAGGAFVIDRKARHLHPHTIRDYEDTMIITARAVGADRNVALLDAADAGKVTRAMAHMGTARRLKHITTLRGFIKWCGQQGIPCGWVRETFTAPGKAERRRDRAKRRRRPYTASQLRRLMQHASDRMRGVILVSLNTAMGPDELTTLTGADVKGGLFDKPRQKTGVDREVLIWPETLAAVGKTNGLLFPSPSGKPLKPKRLSTRFRELCRRACVPPYGLYNLRRTFRTIADDWGDHRAAAKVMGRELPDVDTLYVLTISRERIERMLSHVKSSLRVGCALAARRYRAGERGLAKRVEARRSRLGKAKSSTRPASNATGHRGDGPGSPPTPSAA